MVHQSWPDSFLPVSSPRGYVISLVGTGFSVRPFVGAEVCSWRVMRGGRPWQAQKKTRRLAGPPRRSDRRGRSFSRGWPSGRPRNSKGLKPHPARTNSLESPPIGVSSSLQARFSGNCRSGPLACSGPARVSAERPPPAFRPRRFLRRHGQGLGHGLDLL